MSSAYDTINTMSLSNRCEQLHNEVHSPEEQAKRQRTRDLIRKTLTAWWSKLTAPRNPPAHV